MAVGLADNRDTPVTNSPYLARVGACVSQDRERTATPAQHVSAARRPAQAQRGGNRYAPPAVSRPRAGTRPRWDVVLAVSCGGALGSLARWGVNEVLPTTEHAFPWGTFVENLSGGFLLGVLTILLLEVWPPSRYLRPFLGVGVLGGYTTFSAYMLQTRDLLIAEQYVGAAAYLFGTLVFGLAAVWLGMWAVRGPIRLRRARRGSRHHRTRRSI